MLLHKETKLARIEFAIWEVLVCVVDVLRGASVSFFFFVQGIGFKEHGMRVLCIVWYFWRVKGGNSTFFAFLVCRFSIHGLLR